MSDLPDPLRRALNERYVLERELGRGGMATVYLAQDVRHHRAVAVKVLDQALAAALGPERFVLEIELAAQLSHPHLVPLYDSGNAAGFLYYVMPFVEGESLRACLQRERHLPVDRALRITQEVADGLAYAHSRGFVHRDIKPENILLSSAHSRVTDFGLARAITAAGAERLTATGITVGTPAYMSPEQWARSDQLDGRSDLYSLACVLYEMLVGEPPFAGSSAQVILARQSIERIPPIRLVRPTVPPGVEAAITKALAKVPADRFATALEFSGALSSATASPIAPPIAPPARPRGRRRALTAVAVGVVVLGGAAGLARVRSTPVPGLVPGRVVVSRLDNRTGDSALRNVGSMAADWITQGLEQTGIVDIVPSPTALAASGFVAEETRAGRVRDPIVALARETGAGTVVSGAYYREGDALEFHVQVTVVHGSRPIGTLEPVRGDPKAPGVAIARLRDHVMGLLAVSLNDRLAPRGTPLTQPPTYAAYHEFAEGMERYIGNAYRDALPYFSRAAALDATFVAPLLYAAFCHTNLGERAQADSLARALVKVRDRLSDYDRHWLDYLRDQLVGDHEAALEAVRRAAELAPGSKAAYNVALLALATNRPREALASLATLEPERGAMRGWFQYWSVLTEALHRVGDHRRELDMARRARRLYPERLAPLQYEAVALAALGRADDLTRVLDGLDTLTARGRDLTPGAVMIEAADELRAHGHLEAAQQASDRGIRWYESRPAAEAQTETYRAAYAAALDEAGRWKEAERVVRSLPPPLLQRASYRGWLGVLAARRGDRTEAEQVSHWLARVREPYLYGLPQLQQARIAAVLGDRDHAVALLRDAFAHGVAYAKHPDSNFESLAGFPPFEALFAIKG